MSVGNMGGYRLFPILAIGVLAIIIFAVFFMENKLEKTSEFSFLYLALYENQLSDDDVEDFKARVEGVNNVVYRESLGRIKLDTTLMFLDIKTLGDKSIDYNKRNFFEWYSVLRDKIPNYDYDILGFSPVKKEIVWCTDALSVGFSIDSRTVFCMENNLEQEEDFVFLTIHKIMHGWGYNHMAYRYRQLLFLGGYSGLPYYSATGHLYFNRHFIKALGIFGSSVGEFDSLCGDYQHKLSCLPTSEDLCLDAWGPYCSDIDEDGILDSGDKYVFTPPGKGDLEDSDKDGIPNELDLCSWNEFNLEVNGCDDFSETLSTIYSPECDKIELKFSSPNEIIKIEEIPNTSRKVLMPEFDVGDYRVVHGDTIKIEKCGYFRLKIYYTHNQKEYYRPFYVFLSSHRILPKLSRKMFAGDTNFFLDQEWYYFDRFGCDIPSSIDIFDVSSYDSSKSGLPDKDKVEFAQKIDENYDWDGDGVADIYDTLPTIYGGCNNEYVKGVLDSDSDGLCDPVPYISPYPSNQPIYSSQKLSSDIDCDACPYLGGIKEAKGCPDFDKDGLWWYDDSCPFSKGDNCPESYIKVIIN